MLPLASTELGAVSPTMYARLACPARVAFGQGGSGGQVASSETAIVGLIAHQAMELAVRGQSVDEAWSIAVNASADRGEQPDSLTRLRRMRLRYQLRVADALTFTEGVDESNVHCEVKLTGEHGTIEGTPDLVVVRGDRCDIVDFKTGLVIDLDEQMPKADYARQIRIYAHLAEEAYGVAASRGVLLSFREGPVDINVGTPEVNNAVREALDRRQRYNDRVPGPQPPEAGNATCRWCSHQVICDGFWEAVGDSSNDLAGQALRGTICVTPQRSQNALLAVQVDVSAGARAGTVATIAEIPVAEAEGWAIGDELSVTGLRHRPLDHDVFFYTKRSTSLRNPK